MPYTRSINIYGDFANVSSGYDYWGRMPDPFDPRFAAATEQAVLRASTGVQDDPLLLGYFADNELAWAGVGPLGRWGLAIGTLSGDARSPAKQAFIAVLRKKYVEPETLASAWGIALGSWDALAAAGFHAPPPDESHPAITADYSAWLRTYAEQYFRTVADAIHRHDRHHLFLGGRFAVQRLALGPGLALSQRCIAKLLRFMGGGGWTRTWQLGDADQGPPSLQVRLLQLDRCSSQPVLRKRQVLPALCKLPGGLPELAVELGSHAASGGLQGRMPAGWAAAAPPAAPERGCAVRRGRGPRRGRVASAGRRGRVASAGRRRSA
ncbi:MAG: hypothetical protein WDW38_006135 [Sanguina aurantia]